MAHYYIGARHHLQGTTKQQRNDLERALPAAVVGVGAVGWIIEADDPYEAADKAIQTMRQRAREWDEDSPARKAGRMNPFTGIAADLHGLTITIDRTDKPTV